MPNQVLIPEKSGRIRDSANISQQLLVSTSKQTGEESNPNKVVVTGKK